MLKPVRLETEPTGSGEEPQANSLRYDGSFKTNRTNKENTKGKNESSSAVLRQTRLPP